MVQETPQKQLPWLEQFRAGFDLDKIPENIREDFQDLLEYRAAARAYYLSFPEERFNEGIGKGDSPHKELVHHVGHSRLRIESLETGIMKDYKYEVVHPEELAGLNRMNREQLIGQLDRTTEELYSLYTDPALLTKTIQLPWGRSMTGARVLRKAIHHEVGHDFKNIGFQDYFGTLRPQEMKNVWG